MPSFAANAKSLQFVALLLCACPFFILELKELLHRFLLCCSVCIRTPQTSGLVLLQLANCTFATLSSTRVSLKSRPPFYMLIFLFYKQYILIWFAPPLTLSSHVLLTDYDYNPQVLSDGETPSLIINCGVSGMLEPGFFKLEQRARNATYEKKDVDNGTPPGGICIAGGAAEFQSVLDLAKVIEEVKGGGASAPKVSVSTDAGLYLCEFTFYRSMLA